MSSKIKFSWIINFTCNYRCPYCVLEPCRENILKQEKIFSIKQILSSWTHIKDKYGEVAIYISGGEPTIYPNFFHIIKELSILHHIYLNTNLSVGVDYMIDNLNSSRIGLSVSFHPLSERISDMIGKLRLLKARHWDIEIACVAWPPLICNLEQYHVSLQDFNFKVIPFRGIYDGKTYPFDYTQEEEDMVNNYIAKREGVKFSTKPSKVTGRMCCAGQVFANIMPNGEVLRCGSGHELIYNDFFNGNFNLLDKPGPCKAEYCDCSDWVVCQ
jgi:MoaA/NifB/PqqE/SkfB family radical SAM enzyme